MRQQVRKWHLGGFRGVAAAHDRDREQRDGDERDGANNAETSA